MSSSLSSPSLPPRPPLLPTVSSAAGLNPNCPADDDDDDGAISSDSSSIGSPSDDDEDVQEEETESKSSAKDSQSSSLSSLGSLEDSLPIKRGLSTHFAGKSRSFVNLAACAAAGDVANLAKQENPFNKRRRIQIASKISYKRRASCSALVAAAMPSSVRSAERAVREVAEGEEDEGDEEEPQGFPSLSPPPRAHGARFRPVVLRSPRSVPLFDL